MPWIEVIDRPHDKAVEQRNFAVSSSAGLNPATGKEFETLQNAEEALFPARIVLELNRRKRARDPTPTVRNSMFAHRVIDISVLGSPHVT